MEKFTVVYQQVDDWWIGFVEELPGANTQGKTLTETRENLKEAIELVMEANDELAGRKTVAEFVIQKELLIKNGDRR